MKKSIIYLALFFPFLLQAQQQLSLKNALDTALKNSYDIQIADNNFEINKINNTYGVAGGLPTVSSHAGDDESVNTLYQKQSSGTIINSSNSQSNSLNTGIDVGLVLFNGFKIVATKEKLNCLQKQSELLLNQQIQNTIGSVMIKYYDVIRQENYLKTIQSSLDVSNKKLEIINNKNDVGLATAMDILQAQADVNSAEQNFKAQQLVIDQAKTDLQLLMNTKEFSPFTITDSIVVDKTILLDSIVSFLTHNPQYLSAEQQVKINEQVIKEIKAQRYPSLKLNAGYDFNYTQNTAGLTLVNRIYGPTAGLTLQIPIYNGNVYNINSRSAKIDRTNSILQKESLYSSLEADAIKTYQTYTTTLQQLESQQANFDLAKKLLDVVLQNFQLKQATILDVKAAQSTFEEAAYLLINLKYSAKIAEIQLKQLVYQLKY